MCLFSILLPPPKEQIKKKIAQSYKREKVVIVIRSIYLSYKSITENGKVTHRIKSNTTIKQKKE